MKNSILAKKLLTTTITSAVLIPSILAACSLQPVFAEPPAVANKPYIKKLSTPPRNQPALDIKKIANQNPKIEVVFVLDTTGSMSGLIQAAKEKIWSIASTMASAQNAPEIKMGLVAFRDRGDAYITKTTPLTTDLDSMYSTLMDFKANGGGDGPESVNKALYDAVHKMLWSQDKDTYKVIFLIGDAPAHMDYQDDVKYPTTIAKGLKKDIVINAIQSGQNNKTKTNWQQIATLGQGNYFQVEDDGNAVAIATPFDQELADLSKELDNTRVYYGNKKTKLRQERKVAASTKLHNKSSLKSLARRATYNTSASGKDNFLGESELVDAISSGKTTLEDIDKNELPTEMQTMKPKAQKEYVFGLSKKREALKKDIKQLSEKRNRFLKKKVAKSGADKNSLDAKIFGAIKAQAAEKGLVYDSDSAKY
ncbi:MAG: VWA domain-containing protein [Cocleimonas sp.]|nr:VWA domain-containing protein [Cocleimonas sp.]